MPMLHPRLKVFLGPENEPSQADSSVGSELQREVTVTLGDVLPILADALETRRAWLRDFEEDKITLSADLYEVLLAYAELRPAA
jgi:hypothetical protein